MAQSTFMKLTSHANAAQVICITNTLVLQVMTAMLLLKKQVNQCLFVTGFFRLLLSSSNSLKSFTRKARCSSAHKQESFDLDC